MTKLWGGRFSGAMDARMALLNNSMPYDVRLWDADIQGSIAYARALGRAGVLTGEEVEQLIDGLKQIHVEFEQATFTILAEDEDIHTAVERRLKELKGPVAGKLHTGRSRNDQVATDMRLYTMAEIKRLQTSLRLLLSEHVVLAQAHVDTLMPGYTHLQRAQPIVFAHWVLAYFWEFSRDVERLADCLKRTNCMPLGSGALAGNPLAIDRAALAQDLGFRTISQNSMDGVSDRDFIVELLFCCALIGSHLSRLAEDLVIYSTSEFGFVTLDDAFSTGSSLMPQKKNPDAMELVRGKAGRLTGNLMAFLTVMKGLPMTYDKDMQEDKELFFDSLDILDITLPVVAATIRTLKVNSERMSADLDPAMLAADVADYLVRKGVPFREAHHLSGRAVLLAEQRGIGLNSLSAQDWAAISPQFESDIRAVFQFAQSVASRDVTGGTSPRSIQEQIQQAIQWLADHPA